MNLLAELDPQDWGSYKSHHWQVELVKKWIATEIPQCLYITGKSGVGKTSLVRLLIKSTHCLNREVGDYNPCNKCVMCLGPDPRLQDRTTSNVLWVQGGIESDLTLSAQVDYAIERAQRGPYPLGQPHQNILFIVMDEWSPSIPRSVREKVLFWSEVQLKSVVFIFISMRYEDLDPNEFIAQSSRGRHLHLDRFTTEDIASVLTDKLGVYPEPAWLIAKKSQGSLRKAINDYANCKDLFPTVTEEVVRLVLGGTSRAERNKLWDLLETGNIKAVREYVNQLTEYVKEEELAEELMEDVEESIALNPNNDNQLLALTCLINYMKTRKGRLYHYLFQLMGIRWR